MDSEFETQEVSPVKITGDPTILPKNLKIGFDIGQISKWQIRNLHVRFSHWHSVP